MRFSLAVSAVFALSGTLSAQGSAPALTRVQLANGSFNTADRTVSIAVVTSGEPAAYRASESKDFTGAAWRSLSGTPSFSLSSTPGRKIVYVQVGKSAQLTSGLTSTARVTSTSISYPGDLVPAPTYVSAVVADTIVLGMPDLQPTVELQPSVLSNTTFDFWVTVKNAGQITPPGQPIHLYNSFVENYIVLDRYEVTFGLARLVGDGCKVTDVSTIECWLAPLAPGAATAVHVFGHTVRAPATTVKLRTRIEGIRESNTANNWLDTPLRIVR
ncbi:MAG TPA: hypothetical protein VF042_05645 [Gemmatimonadaceae bacterium]